LVSDFVSEIGHGLCQRPGERKDGVGWTKRGTRRDPAGARGQLAVDDAALVLGDSVNDRCGDCERGCSAQAALASRMEPWTSPREPDRASTCASRRRARGRSVCGDERQPPRRATQRAPGHRSLAQERAADPARPASGSPAATRHRAVAAAASADPRRGCFCSWMAHDIAGSDRSDAGLVLLLLPPEVRPAPVSSTRDGGIGCRSFRLIPCMDDHQDR
jgi:hypothetical protein